MKNLKLLTTSIFFAFAMQTPALAKKLNSTMLDTDAVALNVGKAQTSATAGIPKTAQKATKTAQKPATTFVNPILGGDYPDPTILRDGEDYYMTHSAFDYVPGLVVWHSRDLVHWEPISYALKTYLGSIWAPDIKKYRGK